MEEINILTEKVLKLAFDVHSELGAGLLESTYETCLFYELTRHNIKVERQTYIGTKECRELNASPLGTGINLLEIKQTQIRPAFKL